jgi:hypothetical protein
MSRLPKSRHPLDESPRAPSIAQRPEQAEAGSSNCLNIILYPLRLLGRSALAAVNPAQDPQFPSYRRDL